MDTKLLRQLCEVHAPSGNESAMRALVLAYLNRRSRSWKSRPEVVHGDAFQDCLILKFGKPRTAIFAHMDSVGFTVRYFDQLVPVGSPEAPAGTRLIGEDSLGPVECELQYDHEGHAIYRFGRVIDRGTDLTYKVNFRNAGEFVESASLDNRVGVYAALKVAETLTDGVICFSCGEEHGGGTVPFLIRHVYETWGVHQTLVADVTWTTDGVRPGSGPVISLRDRHIPRRTYVNRIAELASASGVRHQHEVEGTGSSDGRELQASPYPIDWCFVGVAQEHPHTPAERVHKKDVAQMISLYEYLMRHL
ncbi:MAG TPA: M20/M25/M40 family metallo-hydrolase [Cyclobacteriaceae bacterium]